MINLLFVFINLIVISVYDIWKMAKSEFLYWGYGEQVGAYNDSASQAASLSQFAIWYFYVVTSAFLLFSWEKALVNIACIVFLHWCGIEDLLYFLFARWIKLPQKYLDTHPQIKILGFGIPVSLYWLSVPRKIGFITIPSIIGFVCGKDVPGKRFVIFSMSAIVFITILSFII
jgi:hypothetical protein